jgi:hypothetical protein
MQGQYVGVVALIVARRINAANACGISTRQRCRAVGLFPAIARAGALPRAALLAGVSIAALATLAPVVPENSVQLDSRGEGVSAHHPK